MESIIKRGDLVELLQLDYRKIARLKVGQVGEVLAVRGQDALVKFRGKSGPVAVRQDQLEVVTNA